jgi:Outer membrane protein beta-barrel domain
MKITILLITILCQVSQLFAQISITGKINFGISRITPLSDPISANYTTSFAPSFSIGIHSAVTLKKNVLSIELLANRVNGKYKYFWEGIDADNLPFELTGIYKSHITYLSIPLSYELVSNKVNIQMGVQPSFGISKFENNEITGILEGKPFFYQAQGKMYIKNFEIGPRIGCSYHLNENLWLEVSAYYGLKAFKQNSLAAPKIFQSLIGLRYNLMQNNTGTNN